MRIQGIFLNARIPTKYHAALHEELAKVFVRENRLLRKQVAELKRGLLDGVSKEEEEYGSAVAAYAGEETCEHILTEILRKHVYYNTAEARKRQAAVEEVIDEINKQDPPV
mgnify:FL=1